MTRVSFSKRFNTEKLFNIDTTDFEYHSLEELACEPCHEPGDEPEYGVYVVRGIYINKKSLYDPSPVIALDDCYVNFPAHLLDVCQEMLSDRLVINAINEGHCGFRVTKYRQKRFNKDCYSVEWVDL